MIPYSKTYINSERISLYLYEIKLKACDHSCDRLLPSVTSTCNEMEFALMPASNFWYAKWILLAFSLVFLTVFGIAYTIPIIFFFKKTSVLATFLYCGDFINIYEMNAKKFISYELLDRFWTSSTTPSGHQYQSIL